MDGMRMPMSARITATTTRISMSEKPRRRGIRGIGLSVRFIMSQLPVYRQEIRPAGRVRVSWRVDPPVRRGID
jgi:hypothetical protein